MTAAKKMLDKAERTGLPRNNSFMRIHFMAIKDGRTLHSQPRVTAKPILFVQALLFCLWLMAAGACFAQPSSIIVIRHAEKADDPADKGLSDLGRRRAESLAAFLESNPDLKKLGQPAVLYATALAKGGRGQRCQQTLKPLGVSLGLPVQTPFKAEEGPDLARQILADEKLKGKTVLICWTHEKLPDLFKALGVSPVPPKLQDEEYDAVYLITSAGDHLGFQIVRQDFRP